jgi:hypothetical protein
MFQLLKDYTHRSLRIKLTLIYILNALDIIFTVLLLKTGLFYEANFLMQKIVTNCWLSILVKLILPAIFIMALLGRLDELDTPNSQFCNVFMNIVLLIYTFINLAHLSYVGYYFLH